ncbi:MAG TPA: RlmE family RNA methyltransferase [Thermoplasmata archaeon]|nr:RlmE family RNA methyltransferase [Thermoplasmata archaeon]
MSKGWRSDRKRDFYYRKAKREDYRSRAAYKLKQLDSKFDIIQPGDRVVDLGASPGGWSQVALELTGSEGRVLAMDIERFPQMEGVTFLRGDIRKESALKQVIELLPEGADVVLSDMSPNISGNYPFDHACSIDLCEHALVFASQILRTGGCFVVKMFFGDMSKTYISRVRKHFKEVHVTHPKASRSTSSEVYVVALGFRGIPISPRTSSS